jgi:hypothetical protein
MLCWVTLLSLTMLCAQGTRLHIHFIDCGKTASMDSAHLQTIPELHQHAKIHLVTQDAHWMHASDGLSVLDMSPEGLMGKALGIELLFVIVGLLLIYLPVMIGQSFSRPPDSPFKIHSHYSLSPPLRAPPAA